MTFDANSQQELPPIEKSAKYMAWNIKQIDESLKVIATSIKDLPHGLEAINNTLKAIGKVLQSPPCT